jgi:hypothetical protein
MRKGFQILAVVSLALLVYSVSFAASSSSLATTVTLTGPSGVNPVALKVMGKGTNVSDWITIPQTSLNFDPLTLYNFTVGGKTYSVFLSDHFFSIDMAYTYGGAAIGQMTFSFSGIEPAGQTGHGLGVKATATFVKKRLDSNGIEVLETPADRVSPGKVLLKDVNTASITLAQLSGGWLRVYVGLVTKDPLLGTTDIENATGTLAEVFSPGDVPGPYSGTLIVTSL